MKDVKKIVLYGGGGGAIDIAKYIVDQNNCPNTDFTCEITDVIDDKKSRHSDLVEITGSSINTHQSTQTVEEISEKYFLVTVGSSPARNEIYESLKNEGLRFHTVIHPSADVSPKAKIGDGSIISPFVLLGAFSSIGENVYINIRATVGHDSVIGESSIVSPHVAVCGEVSSGKGVYYGAGVVVNRGLIVGDFTKLSSGAVVAENVKGGSLVYGNPSKYVNMFNRKTGKSRFSRESAPDT